MSTIANIAKSKLMQLAGAVCLIGGTVHVASAAELKIFLPQGRSAFQTNEAIDVAIVRSAAEALPAGQIVLTLSGQDGTRVSATLPSRAVAVSNAKAQTTQYLHLNGWLLRPGAYTVEVTTDGATAKQPIEIHSHIRRSSYKVVNWDPVRDEVNQLPQGEDSFGFNLVYAGYTSEEAGNFIRAGVDFMGNCVMGGGHQMDLRAECDWSDPYAMRGGTGRAVRWAMMGRAQPNVPGVHYYDEPGLTWVKDPATGEATPHYVPSQKRSYESAFGKPPIGYREVDPKKPADVAAWKQWATWKLGFMNAAWKDANFAVTYVRPDFRNVTQSEYGWTAFTDGYYFNVVNALPIVSGHGGYDDYGAGYFNPSYTLEMARARNYDKSNYYLPGWYDNTPSDRFRMEQYISFATGIQGIASPPGCDPAHHPVGIQGIVESNILAGRLGTIFTTMPTERQPIGLLYSMSNLLDVQTQDRSMNYAHATRHGQNLQLVYLALKRLQQPFTTILDEDIVDGTLAANQKALILTSIDHLDAPVIKGLEEFIQNGGVVLKTSDTKVDVKGAIDIGATPVMPDAAIIQKLMDEKKYLEAGPYMTLGKQFQAVESTIKALKGQFEKAAIKPAFDSDNPGIAASRQAYGDVEYLFAVNATYDPQEGKLNSAKAADATLSIAADPRPVYDAVLGGVSPDFKPQGDKLSAKFRFGVGEMRVFARTARPIGSVHVGTAAMTRDYSRAEAPIRLQLSATVLDDKGGLVSGAVPMRIRVTDPLGATRYDLYRATDMGTLSLMLPLAVTDPAGAWKVSVEDLLAQTHADGQFEYKPTSQCGAIAGETARALMLPGEADNIFKFARVHHDVTIVVGASDFDAPAAERVKKAFAPWDVRCKIVNAADVNHPRSLSEEEAPNWAGLDGGRSKPGKDNSLGEVGFAIEGPVILVGNPDDNPLIKFMAPKFLPYKPEKELLPGRGRGYLAWQRDAVVRAEDSITAIAYDAEGMSEAVGSLYEAMAGIEPLTKWITPSDTTITPASKATVLPTAKIAWRAVLPDRVIGLKATGANVTALSEDGTLAQLGGDGKLISQKVLAGDELASAEKDYASPAAAKNQLEEKSIRYPTHVVKQVVTDNGLTAVVYWGGTVRLFEASGTVKFEQKLPQDVSTVAFAHGKLLAGLSTGETLALQIQ